MRDIAEAAGTSPGTVTYYYRQLDGLFQQVYEEAVDRFHRQRAQAAALAQDPAAKLLAAIDTGLPSGPDDELCCLLYEFSPRRAGDPATPVCVAPRRPVHAGAARGGGGPKPRRPPGRLRLSHHRRHHGHPRPGAPVPHRLCQLCDQHQLAPSVRPT
ncbi:TetR/AcrR family transcriptional regulator [Micromonospora sp. A200]|uniref:TetR/AcrR family transcriptional regulator n=1 Tax=Micromonospora sp. A200 TaxID=2940568 RepID=UPI002473E490|nr:TetR/AcrR family transcriptional regulator [Micromonospora sp. A200]